VGNSIVGYVIMPNHLHVIIYLNLNSKNINSIIRNAKRMLAYEIIQKLNVIRRHDLLFLLTKAQTTSDIKKGAKHIVFESSFDAKECYS